MTTLATELRLPPQDLADGEMKPVTIDGEAILLCRLDGRYYAVRDRCSHADQALSEGRMRGHTVYCPLHGARFDLRTGACLAPPATRDVEAFVVEEDPDGLRLSRARGEP